MAGIFHECSVRGTVYPRDSPPVNPRIPALQGIGAGGGRAPPEAGSGAAGVDGARARRDASAMHATGAHARIEVNDGARGFTTEKGQPLLFALMAERIFVPSACGGRASCGQCRVRRSRRRRGAR